MVLKGRGNARALGGLIRQLATIIERTTQTKSGTRTPSPHGHAPHTSTQRNKTLQGHTPSSQSRPSRSASSQTTQTPGQDLGDAGLPITEAIYLPKSADLPHFSYSPKANHRADPGEIVWTWVPYEEDSTRGKDRPVLVLAETAQGVIASQLTSRDRTEDFLPHDQYGRAWLDIGSGDWDYQHRRSEVRLDRLLLVPRGSMRREGGRLDKATFDRVVRKIKKVHG